MKALGWLLTGGLMLASVLPAQPLDPLQARLAALRNDQPIRLKVDVELRHKGTAPLLWNGTKKKGRAIVIYGAMVRRCGSNGGGRRPPGFRSGGSRRSR
jgi:hypothetical protein